MSLWWCRSRDVRWRTVRHCRVIHHVISHKRNGCRMISEREIKNREYEKITVEYGLLWRTSHDVTWRTAASSPQA